MVEPATIEEGSYLIVCCRLLERVMSVQDEQVFN